MNQLDSQYQSLLSDIIENGVTKKTRNGETISVFGRQICHKMSEGFPLLTTKKMYWKGIVTELLWFLRGETHLKFLLENDCHIWDGDAYAKYERALNYDLDKTVPKEEFINRLKTDQQFAKTWGELGPIYGKQWRDWGGYYEGYVSDEKDEKGFKKIKMLHKKGIDQIANLINELRTNPDSRRLMVSAWNVGELDRMSLPPCHYGFQVYTRELSFEERYVMYIERLDPTMVPLDIKVPNIHQYFTELNIPTRAISLMWNQRSVDTFLGLPFNIASYGLLLEFIAKEVGMIPDELIGNLGDTHLYSEHINAAKEQILRTPYKLPKLNFNSEWWDEDKSFFESVKSDYFCKCLLEEDIQLGKYESHPAIKAELKN